MRFQRLTKTERRNRGVLPSRQKGFAGWFLACSAFIYAVWRVLRFCRGIYITSYNLFSLSFSTLFPYQFHIYAHALRQNLQNRQNPYSCGLAGEFLPENPLPIRQNPYPCGLAGGERDARADLKMNTQTRLLFPAEQVQALQKRLTLSISVYPKRHLSTARLLSSTSSARLTNEARWPHCKPAG